VEVLIDQRQSVELTILALLGQPYLCGEVLGKKEKTDWPTGSIPPRSDDNPRGKPVAALPDALDRSFPLTVPQRDVHDLARFAGFHVFRRVEHDGVGFADNLLGLISVEPARAFIP